ncbi:MAG TPA: type II secretion system F family protein [Candidatus Saccharimonadia bacterium]|nr:type II secretion system F family protein [Candidatus Saccharimonadia bacterium]
MAGFKYIALNPKDGMRLTAKLSANNEQEVIIAIKKQGLTPIEVKHDSILTGLSLSLQFGKSGVRQKDLILFTRQLATLLNAGLPLVQALRSTAEQIQAKNLKTIIQSIIAEIEVGKSFSQAISVYPNVFSVIYINMIAAGEVSGTLDKSLDKLAGQLEKDADVSKKIRGAFIYPGIVLVVMFCVMGLMVVKVLPAVGNIYKSLPGARLPFLTVWMLALAHFIIHFWWLVIIIALATAVILNYWRKTKSGKSIVDRLKMTLWPIGPLIMKLYMARFSRTAATLTSSGVPLVQVLEITGKSVNNVHIEETIRQSTEQVKLGKSLSETLVDNENFLPLVPSMLKIGEASGTVEQMLDKLAVYYESEVDNEVKNISTLIEPVLMIILGVFAILIVIAVLLPIYSLAGNSNFTSGSSNF